MSHFSVILATKEFPTEEVIQKEMQPFHEFECTGIDDQYVQDLDVTEKQKTEYEPRTVLRLRDSSGNLRDPFNDCYYRDPTQEEKDIIGPLAGTGGGHGISWTSKDWGDGRGYRTKVRFVPEGWEEVQVPVKDVMSFLDFLCDWQGLKATDCPDVKGDHKYGYVLLNENDEVVKVVDQTNPNDKWDYWRVGGRYTGKLQGRGGSQAEPSWEWKLNESDKPPVGLDICQKKNLDVERMKEAAVDSRRKWIMEIVDRAKLFPGDLEEAVRQSRKGHEEWLQLEEPRPRGKDFTNWMTERGYELGARWRAATFYAPDIAEGQSVSDWCQAAPYITSFALLKDGKWCAEGEMGFWAAVSNQQEDWQTTFQKLFDEIPGDYWLAVLDCHC